MVSSNCALCQYFVDDTELLFAPTLERYAFEFVACTSEREGRECRALYRSPHVSLLFILQDGQASCLLAQHNTLFPPNELLLGTGDHGWYHISFLAEIEANRIIVTRKLLQEFTEGRVSEYEWQAELLAERAERLFPMLDPDSADGRRERFLRHRKSLGGR